MTKRSFNGQLHIRLSPKLHEELVQESFSTGQTMNQLCVEAISMKWVFKKDLKWKKLFRKLLLESKTQNIRFKEEVKKLIESQENSGEQE